MGGMDMMMETLLKKIGVDPEQIKKQITQAGNDFKAVVEHFNKRADKTDEQIVELHKKLDILISCHEKLNMLVEGNNEPDHSKTS